MITFDEARALAQTELKKSRHNFVLIDSKTIDSKYGWVFFYAPQKYLETKDIKELVPGSAPFIINRYTGEIKYFGTAKPYTHYLKEYEENQKK